MAIPLTPPPSSARSATSSFGPPRRPPVGAPERLGRLLEALLHGRWSRVAVLRLRVDLQRRPARRRPASRGLLPRIAANGDHATNAARRVATGDAPISAGAARRRGRRRDPQKATMPSPPTAPGTVTEPISVSVPSACTCELVDDAVAAGLDVEELPVGRGRRVDRSRVGARRPEQRELAAAAHLYAAHRGAPGVRRVEVPPGRCDPARGRLDRWAPTDELGHRAVAVEGEGGHARRSPRRRRGGRPGRTRRRRGPYPARAF